MKLHGDYLEPDSECSAISEIDLSSSSIRRWENKMDAKIILEIEHHTGTWKISVNRHGEISMDPIEGSEEPFEKQPMPSMEFWQDLSCLIRNMDERIKFLEGNLVENPSNKEVTLIEKKIYYNNSRKDMFLAGVNYGKKLANGFKQS